MYHAYKVQAILSIVLLFFSFYLLNLSYSSVAGNSPTEFGWFLFYFVYALSVVPLFFYSIVARPAFVPPLSFLMASFFISWALVFGIFAYFQYIYLADIVMIFVFGVFRSIEHEA